MKLKAFQAQSQSVSGQPAEPGHPFEKIVFRKFKAGFVARRLLRSKSRFRGMNEVLFAGFCAWVLAPHSSDLRNDAMRLVARKLYDQACDERLGFFDSGTTAARWKKKQLRAFRIGIYDVLGGHEAMNEAASSFDLEDELEKDSSGDEFVLRLAEIWHYAAESGSLDAKQKISIVKSRDLAGEIGYVGEGGKKHTTSGRNVERYLELFNESIAFRYAAAKTTIPKAGTILDELREHQLTLEKLRPVLRTWFARAKYFDQKILSRLAEPKPGNQKHPVWLPRWRPPPPRFADLGRLEIEAEAIPMPHFDRSEIVEIEAVYGRPPKASGLVG